MAFWCRCPKGLGQHPVSEDSRCHRFIEMAFGNLGTAFGRKETLLSRTPLRRETQTNLNTNGLSCRPGWIQPLRRSHQHVLSLASVVLPSPSKPLPSGSQVPASISRPAAQWTSNSDGERASLSKLSSESPKIDSGKNCK